MQSKLQVKATLRSLKAHLAVNGYSVQPDAFVVEGLSGEEPKQMRVSVLTEDPVIQADYLVSIGATVDAAFLINLEPSVGYLGPSPSLPVRDASDVAAVASLPMAVRVCVCVC